MTSKDLGDFREDYHRAALDLVDLDRDPIDQFIAWFDNAVSAGVVEPNAMTLATVDAAGRPSARVVLLKQVAAPGFTFFTDYRSRKGRDLDANPAAALCFHWKPLERQVRITGRVDRLDTASSAAYYHSRPRGSQIEAWVSTQSTPIASRTELEQEHARVATEYEGKEIPLPPHWGGYRLVPDQIEFWQGRSNRMHDRFLYTRTESGWHRERLSP